jgi:hypothetical protein
MACGSAASTKQIDLGSRRLLHHQPTSRLDQLSYFDERLSDFPTLLLYDCINDHFLSPTCVLSFLDFASTTRPDSLFRNHSRYANGTPGLKSRFMANLGNFPSRCFELFLSIYKPTHTRSPRSFPTGSLHDCPSCLPNSTPPTPQGTTSMSTR